MLTLWIEFAVCAGVIFYSGSLLSRYGDAIAEKTGLGGTWIGLVLMAVVTSLPELINGISSVTLAGVPDIAVGDIMGSCIFNLSLIALMDVLHGPEPIFSRAEQGHVLSASYGIILIGIVTVSMLAGDVVPYVGSIGIYTPAIILIYLMSMKSLFIYGKRNPGNPGGEGSRAGMYGDMTTGRVVAHFIVYAAVIVMAATILPFIGDRLASETGLGRSFVGTFFIGITTSLPELTVSIASVRIGAIDMGIANILGSNLCDIFILALDDIFYVKGPLLADVSATHAVTGVVAVIMTAITVAGLTQRPEKKTFLRAEWSAIMLFLTFAAGVFMLYFLRGAG